MKTTSLTNADTRPVPEKSPEPSTKQTSGRRLRHQTPHLKRIHVNKHRIRSNVIHGTHLAPLTVKVRRENIKCHEIEIHGDSKIIHRPEKPLNCGARVWIETNAPITCYDVDYE